MTKKNDRELTTWDWLILVVLCAIIVTTTMTITAGLSLLWPIGYFIALWFVVPMAIKHDKKDGTDAEKKV